jgi:signal transduction histidine kinase/Na+/proline symporter
MTTPALLALTIAYMSALFAIAYVVDHSTGRARSLSRHPLVEALALGLYATAWYLFGSVGFGAVEGYRFLGIQIGATICCFLVPVIWVPLARLCREQQLASPASLLAFRYRSRAVGALVTVFFVAGSLPYQALQLRAAVESVAVFAKVESRGVTAIVITLLLATFALLYGVRHLSQSARHDGFIAALAVESLVKLCAVLAVTGYAVLNVFGGVGGVSRFLATHPEATSTLIAPAHDGSWLGLLLLSSVGVFLAPRQWHIAMTEGSEAGLRTASWALPAYIFVLNLCIPFLLWTAQSLGLKGSPEYYVLDICRTSGSTALSAIMFLGMLSASSAMIVVTTVALANMLQNQLILPFASVVDGEIYLHNRLIFPSASMIGGDLYFRLRWLRRGLVAGIIFAGYGVHLLLAQGPRLMDLGLASLVAVAQIVPGLCGVMLWRRATARGVIMGLGVGMLAWVATPMIPLLADAGTLPADWNWLARLALHDEPWGFTVALVLGANCTAFVVGSLSREVTDEERAAAAICCGEPLDTQFVEAKSVNELERRLVPALGKVVATREVDRALAQLGLTRDAERPEQLWDLRNQIERNLSWYLGPVIAHAIITERLAIDEPIVRLVSEQLRRVENLAKAGLEGPALALEHARQFLRDVLDELPMGVCALGPAGDIAVWNRAMVRITRLEAHGVLGRQLSELPEPWHSAFEEFATSEEHQREAKVDVPDRSHTLSLHRATLMAPAAGEAFVMLVEDRTAERALQTKVEHQNRLEQIGRFAAGVAHEIGNPLISIAWATRRLKDTTDNESMRGDFDRLLVQVSRIDRIVKSLVIFARTGSERDGGNMTAVFPAAEIVEDAVALARLARRQHPIEFTCQLEAGLMLRGDRQRLEQVLVDLLTNACDASEAAKEIRVEGERFGQVVRLRVVDHGGGMDSAVRERALEPFFSTKSPGGGTGLGLTLVHGIVSDHGGSIAIDSVPGQGTVVTVELPV